MGQQIWIMKFCFLAFFEAEMTKIDMQYHKIIGPNDSYLGPDDKIKPIFSHFSNSKGYGKIPCKFLDKLFF